MRLFYKLLGRFVKRKAGFMHSDISYKSYTRRDKDWMWMYLACCGCGSVITFGKDSGLKEQHQKITTEMNQLFQQKENLIREKNDIDARLNEIRKEQKKLEATLRIIKQDMKSYELYNGQKNRTSGGSRIAHVVIDRRKYQIDHGHPIGNSTVGTILKAMEENTNAAIALKCCQLSNKSGHDELQHEMKVFQYMKQHGTHIGILNFVGTYDSDTHAYMAMELIQGGDLFENIVQNGAFNEKNAVRYTVQLIKALQFIHQLRIVHGDLKPENILLDKKQKQIKIADFGTALLPQSGKPMNEGRTTAYCSPEMLLGGKATPSADIWAVGCILFVLLCARHPFDSTGRSSKGQIEANIVTQDVQTILHNSRNISKEAKDLLLHILQRNPKQRYSIEDILAHPWVQNNYVE